MFLRKIFEKLSAQGEAGARKVSWARRRKNGRVHMTWAWTPHSGRTHFAHPPPDDMSAHNFTQQWAPILHYLHAQIYRTHGCAFVPTYPHKIWAPLHTQTCPHFIHAIPQISDTQTCRWTHTFRQILSVHELHG